MPEILRGLMHFFLGLASGFVLFAVMYVYFMVRGKHMQTPKTHKPDTDVKEEELKAMIEEKQKTFKALQRKGEKNLGKSVFDLSYELIDDISRYYFPLSKHPMLELSVNEIITLNHYITDRIDQILNDPLLKNTRNIRITKIVRAFEVKKALDEKKVVKIAKSKTMRKTAKVTLGVLNLFNPAYWFRKLVINTSIDFVTRKVCLMIIGVVGEETSKIYSKKLFDKDVEFDLVEKELKALEAGADEEETENEDT